MDENRGLWHKRLCNMNNQSMGRTGKLVNGIPRFSSETYLDGCDVCFNENTRRTAEVHGSKRRDTMKINQGLIQDWVYIMKKYHDK